MASQVAERHLNHNWTFQAPLRQFKSLAVKPDLSRQVTFMELLYIENFVQLYVSLLTLRKAVKSTLRSFTYRVISRKFAISCCANKNLIRTLLSTSSVMPREFSNSPSMQGEFYVAASLKS